MPNHAFQTQFRQEFIQGFEVRKSLLLDGVTTEAVINGNKATFLVADSGGAEAQTRGLNGLIPGRGDNLNQYECQLVEYHDKPQRSGFNIFSSQGDARRIMQETSMAVLNRKIEQLLLAELGTATNDTGSAATGSLALIMKAQVILSNNYVANDGNVTCVCSPGLMAYLLQLPAFASADFVSRQPLNGGENTWADEKKAVKWNGMNFVTTPMIAGLGTNAEKCFMFHKGAIGFAAPRETIMTDAGYNSEHDYSYVRTTSYMGAKLLQNSGVVVINHDSSAFAAA